MKKTNVIDSFRMVRTRRSVSETIVDRIHQMIQENGGRKNNTTKEKDGRANNKRERSTLFDVILFPLDPDTSPTVALLLLLTSS